MRGLRATVFGEMSVLPPLSLARVVGGMWGQMGPEFPELSSVSQDGHLGPLFIETASQSLCDDGGFYPHKPALRGPGCYLILFQLPEPLECTTVAGEGRRQAGSARE